MVLHVLRQIVPPVPSGNDTQSAHAYYEYLHAQYLAGIPGDRTTILTTGPMWIAIYAIILILFFYLYVRFLTHTHHPKGDLYGSVSFAGSILERIGKVSIFTVIVSIAVTLWAIYFIMTQILHGQLYYGVLYY